MLEANGTGSAGSGPVVGVFPRGRLSMAEWFQAAFPGDDTLRLADIVVRLGAALLLGAIVGGIYRATRRRPVTGNADLTQTLLLLAVVIAMITLAIGSNVARAFSLVGALAIVRFRSVVDDPRDTAFVILAVAVGLAVGAGFLTVPLVGLPLAALVAWGFAVRDGERREDHLPCRITVRVAPEFDPARLEPLLAAGVGGCRLRRVGTAKKGTLIELSYGGRLDGAAAGHSLVRALLNEPGVAGVDLACGRWADP